MNGTQCECETLFLTTLRRVATLLVRLAIVRLIIAQLSNIYFKYPPHRSFP